MAIKSQCHPQTMVHPMAQALLSCRMCPRRLNPASTYHYRVVATNSGGTSYGEDEIVSTPLSAPLASESVSNVSSDSALLNAQINPGGNETTYRFEYATEAEFQSAGMTYSGSAPLSGGKLASGVTFPKYLEHAVE